MKFKLTIVVFAISCSVLAQTKNNINRLQFWGGYISSVRIHSKLSLWNDAHYVPESFFIGRHGLSVHLNEQMKFTAGYAWLFLSAPFTDKLIRFEHRPWSQLAFVFPVGQKYLVNHRIRYDARFRQNIQNEEIVAGYGFNHRLRFMTSIRRPLKGITLGKKTPFISIANEVLLNFGTKVFTNYLDQNRTWLMVGYEISNATFQFGYMYRFVPTSTLYTYNHFHGITLWVSQVFTTPKKRQKYAEELLHRSP